MPSRLCTLDQAGDFNHYFVFCFFLPCLFCLLFCSPIRLHLVSSFFLYLPSLLSPLSEQALHRRSVSLLLGSAGSETVTQSSLVIGHGHANQTGRNLQLIRILPPAIIPPQPPFLPFPTPTKLITFGGLFPLLVFLF